MPRTIHTLQEAVRPNLPWAEDHFQERVGRAPTNPGVQWRHWPWANSADRFRDSAGVFTHTYQERFWPKQAGDLPQLPAMEGMSSNSVVRTGIRYPYGDLDDVLELLRHEPLTRQAFLPIFFPEDTGAVHGGRIPCSIGYHVMRRDDHLHMWYWLRSVDLHRHFRDDVYMATRLAQWILFELQWTDVVPGDLYMQMSSLHVFVNDFIRMFGGEALERRMHNQAVLHT